jgi:hypothetical protein
MLRFMAASRQQAAAEGEANERLLEVALAVRSSSSATVPLATVRPFGDHDDAVAEALDLLHDVGREDDALAAACGRAQPAQALAQSARGEHVEAVGRLVEDDVGGSCTSARASAVFIRSPWLKPSVRRSSSAVMSNIRARSCARASAASRSMPWSAP